MTMALRKSSFISRLVPIPEVAPRGALVKVILAGGHLRKSLSTNYNDDVFCPNELQRTTMDNDNSYSSSNNNNNNYGKTAIRLHQQRKLRRKSQSSLKEGKNARLIAGINERMTHNFELAGIVVMLGEDMGDDGQVVDNCVNVGDRVVVFPYPGLGMSFTEYLCVPDTQYLLRLSIEIPLQVGAIFTTAALRLRHLVKMVQDQCQLLSEANEHPIRVLLVGARPLILWTLEMMSANGFLQQPFLHLVVASQDEALFDVTKSHSQVHFVQWNREAYEVVLVERTLEALEGVHADVLVSLDGTLKARQTSQKCLKPDGYVISPKPLCGDATKESNAELNVSIADFGTKKDLEDLLYDFQYSKISPPICKPFNLRECPRIPEMEAIGVLEGCPVIRLADHTESTPSSA